MLKDKDIREPLFDFFDEKFGKVRIIEEKQIAKSRADVMLVLEETLVGVEIKSDADTYTRLARQIKDYNKFFDYNYVVVGSSHSKHIDEHIREYWGIIVATEDEGDIKFQILREPGINKRAQKTYKMKRKLSILWSPELARIQEINNMPKYKQKSKDFVITKIMEKVPWELLHKQISEELFQRDYNTIGDVIQEWKLKIVAHWLFNDLWKERDKIINRAIEMLNATIKDENVVDYTDEVKELNKKRKKYEEKLSNLVELRVEGDISKEVYEEKKGVFKKQIEYIDSELLKRDVKNSAIVSNVKTQIQLLTDLLEKKYDVISGDIPEDIVETFIDQIVVHDDYFEWRLRTSTEPVLCKVEGNEKDNTIIFLENDSHKVAAQYRQLLRTSNTLISERNIIT